VLVFVSSRLVDLCLFVLVAAVQVAATEAEAEDEELTVVSLQDLAEAARVWPRLNSSGQAAWCNSS
jgi:hypothetical protein